MVVNHAATYIYALAGYGRGVRMLNALFHQGLKIRHVLYSAPSKHTPITIPARNMSQVTKSQASPSSSVIRPSASLIVVNSHNEVLMVHRNASGSFAKAHVCRSPH